MDITTSQIAKAIRVSRKSVYQMLREGKIPSTVRRSKGGGGLLVRNTKALKEWMASRLALALRRSSIKDGSFDPCACGVCHAAVGITGAGSARLFGRYGKGGVDWASMFRRARGIKSSSLISPQAASRIRDGSSHAVYGAPGKNKTRRREWFRLEWGGVVDEYMNERNAKILLFDPNERLRCGAVRNDGKVFVSYTPLMREQWLTPEAFARKRDRDRLKTRRMTERARVDPVLAEKIRSYKRKWSRDHPDRVLFHSKKAKQKWLASLDPWQKKFWLIQQRPKKSAASAARRARLDDSYVVDCLVGEMPESVRSAARQLITTDLINAKREHILILREIKTQKDEKNK